MAGTPQSNAPVSRTGDTVTVACKLPNGLWMQLFEMTERQYERPDGTVRKVIEAVEKSGRIKLNGAAKFRGGEKEVAHEIHQGAGLTFGVPADAFNAWLEQHKDDEYVRGGMVFAHKRDTNGQAREHAEVLTGFEPIDRNKLPPEFKRQIATA